MDTYRVIRHLGDASTQLIFIKVFVASKVKSFSITIASAHVFSANSSITTPTCLSYRFKDELLIDGIFNADNKVFTPVAPILAFNNPK